MKYILWLVICFVSANIVLAQNLPELPPDPAVKSGSLPNGTAYFVVSNPYMKGMADFAVVQKVGAHTIPGVTRERIVAESQESLMSHPHLAAPSAQEYFTLRGVLPGKNGFVEVTDNATIFKFTDVDLTLSSSVMDSTLLVLMDIVGKDRHEVDSLEKKWFSTSDQAIIVSGDVAHDVVVEKLRMLSYMVRPSESAQRQEYVWKERLEPVVRTMSDSTKNLAVISVSWRLQRTPREYMNTVQPVIYGKFMTELGIIAKSRVEQRLKSLDIPVGYVETDYIDSVESLDDERFGITVAVAPDHWSEAVASIASVMSALDAGKVSTGELVNARYEYLDGVEERGREKISNNSYVDRCISAFIYNAPLASEKDKHSFYSSRELSADVELNLFKSIVAASVDKCRNLDIECRIKGDVPCHDELLNVFGEAWDAQEYEEETEILVPSFVVVQEKIKVKSAKKEHTSGGTIWTLSNGLRVMLCKMPSGGKVFYSLALNGGYGSIKDIEAGEGAYMSDYLRLCKIGGVKAQVFENAIRRQGMTMNLSVDLSKMLIEGRVPGDRMDLLLKALLTVLNDSRIDDEEFGYYQKSEALRLESLKGSVQERISVIDKAICPGYRHSSVKRAGVLSAGFMARADEYMDAQASKVNNGVLVLVGDIDESRLKEALCLYAGGFVTSESAFTRPVINYQPVSGKMLYTEIGNKNSADIVVSMPLSFTADNYYASALTMLALRKDLAAKVAGTGMSLKLSFKCQRYPQERLSVMLSLDEASLEGFAPGTAEKEPVDALGAVRRVLDGYAPLAVSEEELNSYKALLKQQMSLKREMPEYWIEAVGMRYLDGKDFTTGCDAKIDAVTCDRIMELMSSLGSGSRVEYIITEK